MSLSCNHSDQETKGEFNGSPATLAVGRQSASKKVEGDVSPVIRPPRPTHSEPRRPLPGKVAVSDESLKHWGLLAEPFTPEFFFRTPSFKALVHWLSETVIPHGRLHLVRSEIGSGISTAFEQVSSFAGFAELAVNAELTHWTNQPLSQIMGWAIDRFDCGTRAATSSEAAIAKLWLIHAFRPSQVTSLRNRLARVSDRLTDVSIVIRIEDNPSTRLTWDELSPFSFERTDKSELARCVARSIRSAGATQTIFQASAIEQVVRLSKGSFNDLANATHRVLTWGRLQGLSEISSQAVLECFGKEIPGRRTDDSVTYRHAG